VFNLVNLGLVNILLSSDNVLVIALFGEELGERKRIPVLFWSMVASLAIQLGILYALSFLFRISATQSLFGLIICYMAFRLLHKGEPGKRKLNHQSTLSSIGKIAVGNLMMSFENEATLIGLSHGNVWVAWLAIAATSPLIFFASNLIVWILRKFDFVVYAASVLLFKIGLDMIFGLPALTRYVPDVPWILTGLFGLYVAGRYLHRHNIPRMRLF
jgi:predicted tellurium resistance membrane protein TerC